MLSQDITLQLFFHRISYDLKKVDSQEPFLGVPIEQVNYLADMISGDTTTCDVEALYLRRLRGHQPHLQIARRQRP
jgi:hypothetical protein